MPLFDLVEGRWSPTIKAFAKTATHKTNSPYAICMGEKKKLISQFGNVNRPNPIRYKIVKNGELQYSNKFI